MLQIRILAVAIIVLFSFSPQVTTLVLAEENQDDKSVFEVTEGEAQSGEDQTNPTIDNPQAETSNLEGNDISVSTFDFIKMLVALGFVLFLIYFLVKFVTKRNRLFNQGQSIVNLGGTSVGPNKSVQMIKVGSRVLVLGIGDSITLLKEIDDELESKQLIEEYVNKQEQVIEPKDIVNKVSSILMKNNRKSSNNESKVTFSSEFQEQMALLKQNRSKQLDDIKRKGLKKHE
ncbi:flagellar biosynthetic protein FliO [Metabacillus sp. HB246100]